MTALVLLSGGMDSAAALWWARDRWPCRTLTFVVPSGPAAERRAARRLSRAAGARSHREIELPFLAWTGRGRPAGYLPARNLVYLAAAASLAEQLGCDRVVAGQLATDGEDFPDARASWFRAAARVAGIRLELPFIRLRKADVVRRGRALGVPFELTWSCYRDGSRPCGRCPSCREREEALR